METVVKPRHAASQEQAGISQNEQAYVLLHGLLTTLAYKPGEYLNIASLMEDLAMGRTPINHALHRLSNEGLVQIIPRKGVVVSPLSIDDALHMIDVRLANETLCARLAAQHITAEELAQLRGVAAAFDAAVAQRKVAEMMRLDRTFHELIASASRNPVLMDVLRVLHGKSQRFWAISLSSHGHVFEVQDEHVQILDALAAGNADAAEQCVKAHVLSFRASLLSRDRG
ncbi:GntR family transcriptional regulator [Comamonas antarctica]|uniref:GntR family transcriptional regulator n=1 Tax=Comamonas antarctica TaxID=2743470 RepID=A0A6N1WYA5_9BURK|nr:GntR family transcriptional regulator [Comamonas antarctica]QKV52194.1 GntR family transcriptional regulator [Comamonas antarctica]